VVGAVVHTGRDKERESEREKKIKTYVGVLRSDELEDADVSGVVAIEADALGGVLHLVAIAEVPDPRSDSVAEEQTGVVVQGPRDDLDVWDDNHQRGTDDRQRIGLATAPRRLAKPHPRALHYPLHLEEEERQVLSAAPAEDDGRDALEYLVDEHALEIRRFVPGQRVDQADDLLHAPRAVRLLGFIYSYSKVVCCRYQFALCQLRPVLCRQRLAAFLYLEMEICKSLHRCTQRVVINQSRLC
jgi:hypothetical protein